MAITIVLLLTAPWHFLRLGLAQGSYFRQIVVGDAIFTVANAIAVVTCLV